MREEIPEYILCAAVWYKELKMEKPEVLKPRGFAPYNVDHGVVICGWRHPNCIYVKVAITGLSDGETQPSVQGFLTSRNRFVDREEAAKIAYERGQLKEGIRVEYLFSEDIY